MAELVCSDQRVNGGGRVVAPDKRKALRKCDLAMQKAATTLAAAESR